jgi:hypothetical protein
LLKKKKKIVRDQARIATESYLKHADKKLKNLHILPKKKKQTERERERE